MWDIVQKRMETGRPLREEELIHIFGGLCRALQAMHGRFCHRDVKPHNIMLRRKRSDWDNVSDADVVLMDFGSVQAAEQPVESRRDALKVQEDAEVCLLYSSIGSLSSWVCVWNDTIACCMVCRGIPQHHIELQSCGRCPRIP